MTNSQNDIKALCFSTLAIYRDCLKASARGFILNWLALFAPVFYILVVLVYSATLGLIFPRLVSGFILYLISAFCIANYLAFISFAVDGEKIKLREIKAETLSLILPVISVLFAYFIITFLLSMLFIRPELKTFAIGINLILVVIFNAIPEITYLSRSYATAMFSESVGFIKENTIEWFLPLVVLISPILILNPKQFFLMFAQANPLLIPQVVFEAFGQSIAYRYFSHFSLFIVFGFALTFYFMIFRGVLYKKLSTSSRRKRIYQYRFGV